MVERIRVIREAEEIILRKPEPETELDYEHATNIFQYISKYYSEKSNWDSLISIVRNLPKSKTPVNEITKLQRDVKFLKLQVIKLQQQLKEYEIAVSSSTNDEKLGLKKKIDAQNRFVQATKQYTEMVKKLPIVEKIYLVDQQNTGTIYTVINADAFNDAVTTPLFDAQIGVLKTLDQAISIDFRIINIKEIPPQTNVEDIIPKVANLIFAI